MVELEAGRLDGVEVEANDVALDNPLEGVLVEELGQKSVPKMSK